MKEELNDELIVKCEQPENSVTVPIWHNLQYSFTQRCLKKEPSTSGDDTECPCEECAEQAWVPGESGHQVNVKFEMDVGQVTQRKPKSEDQIESDYDQSVENNLDLPDDCIDSFFSDDDDDKKVNEDLNYKCATCPAVFAYKSQLTAHQRSHDSLKPNQCPLCRKIFLPVYLEKHRKYHKHDQCTNCWRIFPKRALLLKHTEAGCEGLKAYACSHCNAVFPDRALCNEHRRTHAEPKVKPWRSFQCVDCERCFFTEDKLLEHSTQFHSRPRPYQCPLCEKTFIRKCDCTRHEVTHYPPGSRLQFNERHRYQCTLCLAYFSCQSKLARHERVHTKG